MIPQTFKNWSPEELAVIIADFPQGGAAACAAQLPGRSVAAIQKKAERLKVCAVFHVKRQLVPGKMLEARHG